jgi:segregation and condensation protein B
VQSSAVIKTLLERRMIRIAGRKQVVGKPFLYGTTREFLLHFGLGTLADLPPLEELEDFFAAEGSGEVVPVDREEQLALESAALEEREEERATERDEAELDGEGGREAAVAEEGDWSEEPDPVTAEAGVGDGRE